MFDLTCFKFSSALLDCCHLTAFNWLVVFPVCPCRLPDHDGRLVLRVRVRSGGWQEVPLPWCPWSNATGARCTSCLGPNGCPGITTEIQVLTSTSGLFDSALFLGCFYLSNISPTPPSKTACSSRQNNKDFVFFFTGLPVSFVYLYFFHCLNFCILVFWISRFIAS